MICSVHPPSLASDFKHSLTSSPHTDSSVVSVTLDQIVRFDFHTDGVNGVGD